MPHIKINKKEFEGLLGEQISDEKLEEQASFLGAHWNHDEGKKWDVETYPNRPDLLSVEGLARAYRGFFNIEKGPANYNVEKGDITVEVDQSVKEVRPFIGCAVVKDVELDERTINGLIQLQEKLHETMGRRRDKLAIGLHDLSQIEPPFTYKAVEPEQVSFQPLEYDREIGLGKILDEHEKGQEYAWILEDEDKYPIIKDSKDKVLSFPPIINNQLTEVTSKTTDIFIDVTGKDLQTVKKALNILATALAEREGQIKSVEVDGEVMPDLGHEKEEIELEYFNSVSGLELHQSELVDRLQAMKFQAKAKKGSIGVGVPAYRTDIMHDYDLIEDAVIAHRYDNIGSRMPDLDTTGGQKQIESLSDVFRETLLGTGALETHTYVLSNREKLFDRMEVEEQDLAEMSNPLTRDYTAVRNWLLPSMMQVLEQNRQHSYPQEFFELEDVVQLDGSRTGASNQRRLAYAASGHEKDYNDIRAVLQVIERDLGVEFDVQEKYKACFRQNRSSAINLEDKRVGFMGEISEEVRDNWELNYSVVGLELNVEKLKSIFEE